MGASLLLNHYGLVDKPNDIDILVDLKDIEKADEVLKSLGQKNSGKRRILIPQDTFMSI